MVTAMKRHISLFIALTLALSEASASIIKGQVLVNGDPITAEYTVLSNNTVGLGSGHNASISQYTSGRITVPSKITSGGKTYNVTQIMPLAFRLCDKVKVVIIREGTTRIGDFAFAGCSHLVEVELPSTTQSIGTGVFCDLPKLVAVLCKAVTPPTWEYKDVCTGSENASLFVPLGADAAYKNAKYTKPELGWTKPEGWGTAFQNIKGSAMEGYRIYSQEDLYELRKAINNPGTYGEVKNIYLEADIDMSDYSDWTTPIADTEAHAFTGTFHGQGHCIRNMKVVSNSVSGLFGYYKGPKITGVRLVDCDFRGKQLAGGLVGQCGACTIDSCYVSAFVGTDGTGGGIVGRTTGHVIFDRCVSHGTNHTFTPTSNNPCIAGIVGSTTGTTITNSAVIKSFNLGDRSGVFVGECTNGGTAIIDFCYATNSELHTVPTFASGIMYGNHIILHGQPLSILDYAGERHDFTYDWVHFQTVYPAAVLGLDAWAYNNGEYPLPDCFADLWPTKPNHAVYGSPALAEQSINVLTPDEDIPASAWLDLSDMGFRHYRFKASQLWIDNNMDVFGKAEQLPLGLSKQITVENGILLEDTLYAIKHGTVQYKEPVYEIDEQNNFVLDSEGNKICIDSLYLFDKIVWEKKNYSLCLPYNVALSGNCTLYQPTQIYDVDGETTALFEAVRDNYVEAFRPYIVVVHNDTVPLGTRAKVICPAIDSKTMQLGDYEFEGTVTQKGNITARENNMYMLEDSRHWLLFKESDDIHNGIAPFTAYFRADKNKTPANRITIVLDDDNPVISVGDFYFTINNEDEENVTATLKGYHGRGGNVVVPATAPYVVYGLEKQVPLTNLAPDIFAKSTAQIWSIDMSKCNGIKPVNIDRATKGNPFYQVDERTIIYMPEGKAQAGRNNVIGTECRKLDITDGWDFVAPYDFHADEVAYDRILYAAKQQDGSYKSMTYTLCLPFSVDLAQEYADEKVVIYIPYYLKEDKELLFSHDYNTPSIEAGQASVVKVTKESVTISATDAEIKAKPIEGMDIGAYDDGLHVIGHWQGTFARIDNEEAAQMNAFTLNNNGKWYRIRSDEGRYRNAWVGAFRAYYTPLETPTRNNYNSVFKQWVAGDNEDPITPFPSDFFTADTDFTNYVDDATGINDARSSMPNNHSDVWFTMDGRKLNGMPQAKGLYIYKGRKIVIK